MKPPNPQRWVEYMRECAERCRRQLVAAQVRAGIRPRVVGFDPVLVADYNVTSIRDGDVYAQMWDEVEARVAAAMARDGHTREMGWYEGALRRGCTDE